MGWVGGRCAGEMRRAKRGKPRRRRPLGPCWCLFSVVGNRERRPRREWDNPLASQPDSLARLAYALRNRFFNHNSFERPHANIPQLRSNCPKGRLRGARGLASKGDSSPVSPTIIRCPFAANPVVASAPTLRVANRVTNAALSPALFVWGLRQRGVDNPVHNASLSSVASGESSATTRGWVWRDRTAPNPPLPLAVALIQMPELRSAYFAEIGTMVVTGFA